MFVEPCPRLKLRFIWLSIGYALVFVVVYLSITSNPIKNLGIPYQDKVFHALAYFGLMSWFVQIYHDKFQRNMIAIIFLSMGVLMEYIQSFEPTRMADIKDVLANIVGVGLGFLLAQTTLKNVLVKLEKWVKF